MSFAKSLKVVLALVLVLTAKLGWASSLPDVEILNRAAEQRSLVISAAKNYVLSAANVNVRASKAAQAAAIEQFDLNMQVLKLNTPNSYIRSSLRTLSDDWETFTALLERDPSNTNVEAVIESSNKLVLVADLITTNWQGLSSDRELEALNLSHHQAMLSERISMLYAAHYYGLKSEWVVMELSETMHEYEKSLDFLKRFVEQDSTIAYKLSQVDNQWAYAKEGFAKFNQGQYLPKLISVTLGGMQTKMNLVAQHYTQTYESSQPSFNSLSIPGLAANIE